MHPWSNKFGLDEHGVPDPDDLHLAWRQAPEPSGSPQLL